MRESFLPVKRELIVKLSGAVVAVPTMVTAVAAADVVAVVVIGNASTSMTDAVGSRTRETICRTV